MKKIYSLLLLAVTSVSFAQTIYTENMGTPTANTLIPAYATGTAPATFQNGTPIVYTGTADVRTSTASSGYSGASAGGNVLINAVDEFFQIDGINTSAFNTSGLKLSFGINTPALVTNVLLVDVSTDATNWTPLTYTPSATGWTLATITSGIPSSTTLSIRFKSTSTQQFRVDDVRVFNLNASCTLVVGTPTTLCNASTAALDTYTATISYTGGGSGSYTITPSAGTVAGDNPGTVAAGNILINNVPEGTAITVNIVSGACSYPVNVASPECKPVNELPYQESFPYTPGNSLGAEQKWTNVNTGDNIVAAAGSLNYAGFTSSGNSVTFVGTGIDCFTPFTSTTSGTVYASFIVNIADVANATATVPETYFAGLTDAAKGYKARIFSKVSAGQYSLGLDAASTTTNYETTLRNPGDVVFVVLGYDFTANTLSAWFNPNLATLTAATPATLTATPAAPIADLGGFILRQDTATTTPTIIFDELRVATTINGLLATSQNTIAGLKMYPNPVANGTLFIETAANAERTVAIFDVLGKQVLNAKTSENAINVSALHTGVYIVNITEEGKTASRKLVIK